MQRKERLKLGNTVPHKYKLYYSRCYYKNIQFDLNVEQFTEIISKDCTYCGELSNGIDRINPKLGYIQGNITPCCKNCNVMKHLLSVDEFKNHIKKIYKHIIE